MNPPDCFILDCSMSINSVNILAGLVISFIMTINFLVLINLYLYYDYFIDPFKRLFAAYAVSFTPYSMLGFSITVTSWVTRYPVVRS